MATIRPPISETEIEVLKVLWAKGPRTVREVEGELRRRKRRLAYNTVLTLLSRLREKGYVVADKSGLAHGARALLPEDLQDLELGVADRGTVRCHVAALLHAVGGLRYYIM